MKRLVALLFASLFAIFSNLSPVLPKDQPFVEDSYYAIDSTRQVNWKSLYGELFSVSTSEAVVCDKTQYQAQKAAELKAVGNTGTMRYWVQPGVEYPAQGKSVTDCKLTATDGEELVAPMTSTLDTSHFTLESRDGGLTLLIRAQEAQYQIKFTHLKCWYCCKKKQPDSDGKFTCNGDNYPTKGMTLEAGKVIGVATANTEMHIYKLSESGYATEISYDQFFNAETQ